MLNVTFEENVGTDFGPERNATVTNAENHAVIPYQANDGQEREVEIVTDKNGVATFEVTGSNTSVTPIVFLDGSYQEWDTKGGIKIDEKDGRYDAKFEYSATAAPVTFGGAKMIEVTGERTNNAAIIADNNGNQQHDDGEQNGRERELVPKKADGSPYEGIVSVGIEALQDDNNSNNLTQAYIWEARNQYNEQLINIKLDAEGKGNLY